jgi:hypothetical protein
MTGFSSACGAQLTLDTLALNSVGHWPGSPARIVQYYYCTILKLSIAVLPFANLSGDPEQEYFADGMAEEIITVLSRIRWLLVLAQFELHLQGPGDRRDASRPRARRALGPRRLGPQSRQPRPHRRAANRCGTGARLSTTVTSIGNGSDSTQLNRSTLSFAKVGFGSCVTSIAGSTGAAQLYER